MAGPCSHFYLQQTGADRGKADRKRNHSGCLRLFEADRAAGCGGVMEPIAVWVRKNGEWAIIHRCKVCGALSSNRIAADDNPMKLMSLAMKPVSSPPFPLERIEEMTWLMGGDGELKW
ncbi:MAG: RNHCP domain-containing protein [Lachnospiraceae bacterium]|nr:RNHCP domain-containing protein [Lachnospiraceae bacterium]